MKRNLLFMFFSTITLLLIFSDFSAYSRDRNLFYVAKFYRTKEWDEINNIGIFKDEIPSSQVKFEDYFYKVYYFPNGKIGRVQFYAKGKVYYYYIYLHHIAGVVIKTYYLKKRYTVHFYGKNYKLNIKEVYTEGEIDYILYYENGKLVKKEYHGVRNRIPMIWD